MLEIVIAAVASTIALVGGVVALIRWIQRVLAERKPLSVSSAPNHTYTQKDGSVILGMHLEITNPSHKARSTNKVRLETEPPSIPISLARVDWTEPGNATILLDLPEGLFRHNVPGEDVLKFPLSIPGEARIGGLIFLYLNPQLDLEKVDVTITLLDDKRELGRVKQTLRAVHQ